MLFVATLLISNAIAVKVITLWGFTLPAGIIVFPIAYLWNDILTEVYGFAETRTIIWGGFFCLACMSIFFWLATLLTPAPFWNDQEAFVRLFGFVPRISISSFLASFLGEFLNSMVVSILKVKMKGRHLWFRFIASTIVGEGADSIVFNLCAFTGVFPFNTVLYIAFSGFILKTLYEFAALPLTCRFVRWLKRAEGHPEVLDYNIKYKLFKLL